MAYHKQIKRAWKNAKSFYLDKVLTSVILPKSSEPPAIEFIDIPPWSLAQQLTFIDQSLIHTTPLQEYRVWADKQDVDRGKLGNICAILDLCASFLFFLIFSSHLMLF